MNQKRNTKAADLATRKDAWEEAKSACNTHISIGKAMQNDGLKARKEGKDGALGMIMQGIKIERESCKPYYKRNRNEETARVAA